MKSFYGGQTVPQGVYLSPRKGKLVQMNGEVCILPGQAHVKYFKVPEFLALAMVPFIGLAFIIFLPFIGIAGVIGYPSYRAAKLGIDLSRRLFQRAIVGWKSSRFRSPGMAEAEDRSNNPDLIFPPMTIDETEEGLTQCSPSKNWGYCFPT